LRLSYCYPEPDRIREGVRRLATVVERELDLRATFGEPDPSSASSTPAARDTAGPAPDTA
jgi:2-aminoadipate transaminase